MAAIDPRLFNSPAPAPTSMDAPVAAPLSSVDPYQDVPRRGAYTPPNQETGVNPMLRVRSNQDKIEEDRAAAQALARIPHITNLSSWLETRWEQAKRAKITHETKMLEDLRQRNGEYDPDDLSRIRASGEPEIFMMLTPTKSRAAAAWIKDTLLGEEAPFACGPTPIPDLPPDVEQGILQQAMQLVQQDLAAMLQQIGYLDPAQMEQMKQQAQEAISQVKEQVLSKMKDKAKVRARKMQEKIEDQLIEGGFYNALEECIDDLCTFPTAILKGPIVRRRKKLQWVQDESGYTTAQVQESFTTEYRRVSCFDLYPLPETSDIQQGGFFERHKLSVDELAAMIGVPGYSEEAIRAAIDDYGKTGLRDWVNVDTSRATAEGRPQEFLNNSDVIEAREFWGKIPGTLLLEFGMSEQDIPDRSLAYEANAWKVGDYVVRAALNPHPTGKRPYGTASYEDVPGQFWGKGPPRLIRDCQRMCNAAGRAIARNMALGSGVQVAILDTRRIPAGESLEEMYPGKIWQFLPDERGGGGAPITFFQPSMIADQLLEIFGYFSRLADDYSGVIASAYGSDQAAGAGKTASGQAMLLTNASKVLQGVIGNIDRGIIERVVENQFIHNMLFDDDESIKGDLVIRAKGSSALLVKEQAQMRRNEFLQIALNPTVQQIIGLEGVRAILAETVKSLQLDKSIVPSEEELVRASEQIAMMQAQAAQMQAAQMQAAQMQAAQTQAAQMPPQQVVQNG